MISPPKNKELKNIPLFLQKWHPWRQKKKIVGEWKHLYSFCVDKYITKAHFNAFGSNLPQWWAWIWTNMGYPNTLRGSLLDVMNWGKNVVNISIGPFKPKTQKRIFIKWAIVRMASPPIGF